MQAYASLQQTTPLSRRATGPPVSLFVGLGPVLQRVAGFCNMYVDLATQYVLGAALVNVLQQILDPTVYLQLSAPFTRRS